MPQMAPLSWLNLFVTFIITFMMINALNYFSFKYENKSLISKMKMTKMNWKW